MKLKHLISSVRMKSAAIVAVGLMAGGISASAVDFKSQDVAALEVINDFLGTEGQTQLQVSVAISLEKTADGKDKFSYQLSGNQLSIQASSGVAACRAFYDFIKANGAGISTWSGKRFSMPTTIVKNSQTEYTSPYRDHQYFNVVTYGYSTPYWDEARWDKELNWMALHGIDMPLMLVGSEQIYRKVFAELYGTTKEQLDEWEVGPAHLPWMRMGNLAGNSFDGPLGDNWHTRQNQLAKHILKRMRELGMKPIVPAFGGFVPKAVAQKLGSYSETGWDWIPTNYKNYRLTPTSDGEFKKIGKKFIELWDAEYESSYGEFKYYLSDSFNEMTVPNDETTLTGYGDQIYAAIKEGSGNNDAVWVTQGWEFIYGSGKWTNGRTSAAKFEALVKNVPDHNFMVLSMSPEYGGYGNKKWESYNNYGGKEWNHTLLPNMGGKNFWTGKLQDYATTFPNNLKNSGGNANCTGWGMTMEGIEYNETLYELIADMGWEANRTKNLDEWMQQYGKARFGNYNPELQALHTTLRNTVYTSYIDHQNFGWQGNGKSNHYYEGGNIGTTNDTFFQGFETFFSAENIQKFKDGGKLSEPLRADLIEFAAFYASARISKACTRIIQLNNTGKKAEANALIDELEKLMYDMDFALTGHPLYDEAKWEEKAVKLAGADAATQEKYRKNARRIVSTWYGNHQGHEAVNDYASRIWAGLIRDYYRPRLIGELRTVVNGGSVDLRGIERTFVPNGDNQQNAPALTTPKRVVDGELTDVLGGITAEMADTDLLDFLKQVVDEATIVGEIVIEKSLLEYSTVDANHWYYINSNNDSYLDRALTVTGGSTAKGDLRANTLTGANSQIWRIVDNGDGTCRLENREGQSFSWDNGPKTYIANIASDMVFELDEANSRYAILPQALAGTDKPALHFNDKNGVPINYGYKNAGGYYGGSVWTLAKADGNIAVTSDEDRARICRRINGFKADVWGNADLYGKSGQPKDAAAIETAYNALANRDLALETYSEYLVRYNQVVAQNFSVPTDAQARKLFDLIISAFQLNPGSNPTGKAALRTALLTAQQALADGETGNTAKARIAPLETAIKAFIDGVVNFPYVSEAPQGGKFVAGSTVITLKNNSTRGGYVTTDAKEGDYLKLTNNTKPTTSAGYWVVSGDDANGYTFYNVGAGATKVLGFYDNGSGKEGGAARAKLYDAATVASQSGVVYKFKYGTNAEGRTVFYTGTNTAWNDRDGWLSYWTHNNVFQKDAGSTFTIETVENADLGETATDGGDNNQGGFVEGTTATITAVFSDGSACPVISDGEKLTGSHDAEPSGEGVVSVFDVISRDGNDVVFKAGDQHLHIALGNDTGGKQKMSDWDGLSTENNEYNVLTLVPGTGDHEGQYLIQGLGTNGKRYYMTLRQNTDGSFSWVAQDENSTFFDDNYNHDKQYRTSYFTIEFTVPEVEKPYAFPLNFEYDKDATRAGRALSSVKITPEGEAEQSFDVEPGKIYRNLTETAVFTCAPGQTLKAAVNYTNNAWMHAYFYIDENHDGQLSIPSSLTDNSSELKSYSFWSGDVNQENSGQNSAGTTLTQGARNTLDMPEFTAPQEAGEYKVRFKVDWNCVDPGGQFGSAYTKNFIDANGGYIVDAVLKVVAASADDAKAEFDAAQERYTTFFETNKDSENQDVQALLYDLMEKVFGITLELPKNEADITAEQYKSVAAAVNAALDEAEAALQDILNPVTNGLRLPIASGVYEIQNAVTVENRGYLVDYTGYENGPSLAECQMNSYQSNHPAERNKEGETCSYWYVHEKDGQYYIISLSSLQEGKLRFLNPSGDKSASTYSEQPVALTIVESNRTFTVENDSREFKYMLIANAATPAYVLSAACGVRSDEGAVKTDSNKEDGGAPWKFIWTSLVPTETAPTALRTNAIRTIEADATIDRIVDYIEKAKGGKALKEDIDLLRDIILKK